MSFVAEPEMFVKYSEVEEISLREYQHLSIDGLRANIRNGMLTQILASMVGSGKTVMAAYLLHECWKRGRRGAFVVDRLSLLGQTSDVLDRYGIPHGVIQSGHPRYKPSELIQVCSIQTLARRRWPQADLVIIDEAHVLYDAHKARITKNDGAAIIGLSATPFTKGLGKFFQGIVNVTTGDKLTNDGFLVPFRVWAAAEPDMSKCKPVAGEWTDKDAREQAMPIIGDVVREYEKHGNGGKAIVFGVDVAHCEELQRQALAAGIRAELYTYRTGDEERDIMLREFRKPDSSIRWLISVAALSRGFDVPDVSVIAMCRPLKSSFAEFVQILGRGLRSHPGKESCTILDLAGNFMRHYPALVDFMADGVNVLCDGKPKAKEAKQAREKKPPVKCPACKFLPVVGTCCPSCGYIFPPKTGYNHAEGELGEFSALPVAKKKALTMQEKATLYGELKYIGISKGYAPGWASNKFREFVGVWPNLFKGELPRPPSAETLNQVAESQKKWSRTKAGSAWKRRARPEAKLPPPMADLFA